MNCWVNPCSAALTLMVGRKARLGRAGGPGRGVLAGQERLDRRILFARHRQELLLVELRLRHREAVRQRDQLGLGRDGNPHAAEQLELGFVLGLLGLEQRHVRLALGHFGLAHVEHGGLTDGVAGPRQPEEVGVALHALPVDLGGGHRLQRGQILERDVVAEQLAGVADVGIHRLAGGALLAGGGEHLSGELPVEVQRVARGERGRRLVEGRAAERRGAGAGVAHAARDVEGREQIRVGVPHPPAGRAGVVEELPVRRAVPPGLFHRFREGQADGGLTADRGRRHRRIAGGQRLLRGHAGRQHETKTD